MEEEDRMIILADMQGQWTSEWPSDGMETQNLVNTYVTMSLQLILTNPYITAKRILYEISSITWAGPCDQILDIFGGWGVFDLTIHRMESLRTAAVNKRLKDFPVTTSPLGENGLSEEPPQTDGHIAWWAPQVGGHSQPFLFSIRQWVEGMLRRCPAEKEIEEDNSSNNFDKKHP